jgi:basic amino acid/polyamine antiporter, APA family
MVLRRRETIVVPVLDEASTRQAIEIASRLAAERGTRILLVAPLFVELELPLDAHFGPEESALREELARDQAAVEQTGVRADGLIVRARHGQLGEGLAAVAADVDAALIVVGAALEPRRAFRRPFSRDVWSVLQDAPCPVLVATGSPVRARAAA